MNPAVGFPPSTVYSITGVTQALPGIVSVDTVAISGGFFLANGMVITFSGVNGMYQLNRERYVIGSLDTVGMTFALYSMRGYPVDTSVFNAYTSGGEFNIISYPAQAGSPPGLMYNNQPITI